MVSFNGKCKIYKSYFAFLGELSRFSDSISSHLLPRKGKSLWQRTIFAMVSFDGKYKKPHTVNSNFIFAKNQPVWAKVIWIHICIHAHAHEHTHRKEQAPGLSENLLRKSNMDTYMHTRTRTRTHTHTHRKGQAPDLSENLV